VTPFVRAALCAAVSVWAVCAQTGVDRQRAAIERQRISLDAHGRSIERQAVVVARQRARALRAPDDAHWETMPVTWAESAPLAVPGPSCSGLDPRVAGARFRAEERASQLPAGLLAAVAAQESSFSPCAVSPAGALGLMQLMPSTAADLGVDDPFDPWQSLHAGGVFLRQLLDHYGGDLSLALGAYNAGPATVDAYGDVPPYAETQNYVANVLARMNRPPPGQTMKSNSMPAD
jgi:soluble lytic murein transglycosylase-like protein